MVDGEFSVTKGLAWALTFATGTLVMIMVAGAAAGWPANGSWWAVMLGFLMVLAAASAVAHIRSFFVSQSRTIRVLLGVQMPEQRQHDGELRPIR